MKEVTTASFLDSSLRTALALSDPELGLFGLERNIRNSTFGPVKTFLQFYVRDLLQLRAQDTDLAEMFAACIKSGVAAMMLRSSGANDLMEATMARVYSSPRKEGELFAGAMKKNRADRNRGNAAEMKPALA